MQRQKVRDLKNTDTGNKYATVSTCLLRDLLDRWDAVEDDVDTMTNQLCTVLTDNQQSGANKKCLSAQQTLDRQEIIR